MRQTLWFSHVKIAVECRGNQFAPSFSSGRWGNDIFVYAFVFLSFLFIAVWGPSLDLYFGVLPPPGHHHERIRCSALSAPIGAWSFVHAFVR